MNSTQTMARDRFAHDFIMVTDNSQEALDEALEIVRTTHWAHEASDKFREQFEGYISQVSERERELGNEIGALLISELLIGFGSDTFDIIARYYIDTDLETRLHDQLASQLKTGE